MITKRVKDLYLRQDHARLGCDLAFWDNLMLGQVWCKKGVEPSEGQVEQDIVASYATVVEEVGGRPLFMNGRNVSRF